MSKPVLVDVRDVVRALERAAEDHVKRADEHERRARSAPPHGLAEIADHADKARMDRAAYRAIDMLADALGQPEWRAKYLRRRKKK